MAKKTMYIIAYVGRDGHVSGVSALKGIQDARSQAEIRTMFAEDMTADIAMVWRYDGRPITKAEQGSIARYVRESVSQYWSRESDTTPMRGGKFGRKYVDSESCVVLEWDGLLLPGGHASWKGLAAQCRSEADEMVRKNMTGPDNRSPAHSGAAAQRERESDPGYMAQARDHLLRGAVPVLPSPPGARLVQQCASLIQKGDHAGALRLLADKYGVPPPRSSTDIQSYPNSYAFYDTASRTIVHLPETAGRIEDVMPGVMAGFFRYMAQHSGWRFHPDSHSSLNIELEASSEFAVSATDALRTSGPGGPA